MRSRSSRLVILLVAQMNDVGGCGYGSSGRWKVGRLRDTLTVKLTCSSEKLGVKTKEREESRITLGFWHEKLGGLCCH